MAKHWKVARKYEDAESGEIVVAKEKWVSVPQGLGQKMVGTGLYQKVDEWDDDAPEPVQVVREVSPRRGRAEKRPKE